MGRKRTAWSIVFVVAVVVLVASLVALGIVAYSYIQGQQKYAGIAEHADMDGVDESAAETATVDWDALLAENPDTVGWLYIPGTAVNYPVVHGSDNEYYLTHDFNGEPGWLASYGAIFLDWRNISDWTDAACFVYGHHMSDGSMFAAIAELADQARFDACRTVYLYTPTGTFTLRTFSLIHCAADDQLVQTSFSNAADRASYVQDKIDRSIVDVPDAPDASSVSQVFAFATCDNVSSGRYVLYASE